MTTYKIQPFLTKSVSLITLQAIARQGLFQKLLSTTKSTILTTVEQDSHTVFADYLDRVKTNPNIRVVPYYQPLVYQHYRQEKLQHINTQHPRGISLLIGNNNESLLSQLDNKIVTLQELCSAFPQKIPLSYRSRDTNENIATLEKRFDTKISKEKAIIFERILMISPQIKMWDEAIQVILDYMPIPFYVPYLKQSQKQNSPYRLTVNDFLSGLQKIHKAMKMAVKNHPDPKIIVFNQRRQLDWMIGNLAPEATQMVIDRNFFTNQPKTMQAVEDDIKMPVQLQAYL